MGIIVRIQRGLQGDLMKPEVFYPVDKGFDRAIGGMPQGTLSDEFTPHAIFLFGELKSNACNVEEV